MLLVWSLLLLACLQEIAHAHVSKTHSALTVPSAETKGKAAKRGRILIPKEHSYWPRNSACLKDNRRIIGSFEISLLLPSLYIYHRHRATDLGGFPKGHLL